MANTRCDYALTGKVEELLLRVGPQSAEQIAKALNCTRALLPGGPFRALEKKYQGRFVMVKRKGVKYFHIAIKAVEITKQQAKFSALPDLWRGWVNPLTGTVPERLGV